MIVKALVADDSPIMRKIIRTNLEKINVKLIKEAKNGSETLSVLRQEAINLLFLDLNMPEPTGWEILDQLHKENKTAEICVIIVSSEISEESRDGLKKSGAAGFIPKPFSIQVFQDTVLPILGMIQNEEKRERLFEEQRAEELWTFFKTENPKLKTSENYLCFEFETGVVKIGKNDLARVAILEHKLS